MNGFPSVFYPRTEISGWTDFSLGTTGIRSPEELPKRKVLASLSFTTQMGRDETVHTQIMVSYTLGYVWNMNIRTHDDNFATVVFLAGYFAWKERDQQWTISFIAQNMTRRRTFVFFSWPSILFSIHMDLWGKQKHFEVFSPLAAENSAMIRLSHTAMEALTVCERKFQLNRLLTTATLWTIHEFFHWSFPRSLAAGISVGKIVKALWKFYIWPSRGDEYGNSDSSPKKRLTDQKIWCRHLFFTPGKSSWKNGRSPRFQDKPATQLSFRVNIDETFYFVRIHWPGSSAIVSQAGTQFWISRQQDFPDCPRSGSTRIPTVNCLQYCPGAKL